jgi:hypothetical protein
MSTEGPKAPAMMRGMAIRQSSVTLTLASGEQVTGWGNYSSEAGVDLILADGTFRWIDAADLNTEAGEA